MVALSVKGPLVMDSEEAVALACWKAMESVMVVGFSEIILKGENVNVMKAISSPFVNLSQLGLIYEDIQCLVAGLRLLVVFVAVQTL